MAYLTKSQILAANDLPSEDVECPEWGGTVKIRALSGNERDRYEASVLNYSKTKKGKYGPQPDLVGVRAKLVAMALVDDSGTRLFSDSEVIELGAKSGAALDRCYDVAARLSGLSDKDVDELVKN